MMAKFQFQLETEHPVLFLCDSTASAGRAPELRNELAVISNDGVSFCVLSYVDGASLVTISDKHCELGGTRFADGVLNAPSGVLALTDAYNFRYINVPVPEGTQTVEVWADAMFNPNWVWIKLEHIREY
jgi:hypothetical protein